MAHRSGSRVPARTRLVLGITAGVLGLATLTGMILLRPSGEERPSLRGLGFVSEVYDLPASPEQLARVAAAVRRREEARWQVFQED